METIPEAIGDAPKGKGFENPIRALSPYRVGSVADL